jgi:hypothetical protein
MTEEDEAFNEIERRSKVKQEILQNLHDENKRLGLYEQGEPAAWMDIDEKGAASGLRYWSEPDNRHEVALYTTPPQRTWVGLTDEQVYEIGFDLNIGGIQTMKVYKAIEAKLKEKNNG